MSDLPANIRVLKNGTHYDMDKGRFVPGIKPTTAIQSSEQGRAMAARRIEVSAAKARKRMVEAYQEHTGKPGGLPSDAYAEIASEFTRSALANAMNKPRDAVHAAKLALKLADMLPADDKQANVGVAVQVVLAPEAAAYARSVVLADKHDGYDE